MSAGMTKEDFFASIMNSDNQHPRDPSRPKRQSRMSREIVSSSTWYPGVVVSYLSISSQTTRCLSRRPWSGRIASRVLMPGLTSSKCPRPAFLHLLSTSAVNHPFSVVDWIEKFLYRQIGVACMDSIQSLVCTIHKAPAFVKESPLPLPESDDSDDDDAASMIGELSLDENREVSLDIINMRRSSASSVIIGAVSWPYQRSSPFVSSRPHG